MRLILPPVLIAGLLLAPLARSETPIGADCLRALVQTASTQKPDHPPIILKTDKSYLIHENPFIQGKGQLKENGELDLDIQLINPNGSRGKLRGKEVFDSILAHFGNGVKSIAGHWGFGDNLELFNQLTAANPSLSLEAAALQTWTGRQAVRHGFTEVQISSVFGKKGNYKSVNVIFTKPQ